MVSKKLVIVANPYPWVNQSGGATADDMGDLIEKIQGFGVNEIHWEVVRNHILFPSEVGEILPCSDKWPGDRPVSVYAHTVDPFVHNIVPLVCMNRHYHGDSREFLQTNWAKERWNLLAANSDGRRLGNGHIMDHLWAEVERHSTELLRVVNERSSRGLHLDFTRGVSLIGFGAPLRAAWSAFENGENDLDRLISIANNSEIEEGPPFTEWSDLPDEVHQLRCDLTLRIVQRMFSNIELDAGGVHIRMLLRESQFMREMYGIDVVGWINSGIATEFSFHNEWVDGEDCEWWSLSPLPTYVASCHSNGLQCFASVDWYGSGLSSNIPERDVAHHVPLDLPPPTSAPNLDNLEKWASDVVKIGVDGVMLYDAHLGIWGGGLDVACSRLQEVLGL